jgi:long-chain acyl-CoA synthetase
MTMSVMGERLDAIFAVDPAAPAIEFHGKWTTWGEVGQAAHGIDTLLTSLGIGAGVRVGAILRNRVEYIPLFAALIMSDRCLATINGNAPDGKLAEDLRKVRAPVLVGHITEWVRPGLREAAAEVGSIGIELTGDPANPARVLPGLEGDRSLWENAEAPGVAVEMLTSGTTGTPKRVPLSVPKFEQALMGMASYEKGRRSEDAPRLRGGVQVISAPFAHIGGVTHSLNNLLAGRKICLLERFTVEGFHDAVKRHRPKAVSAPPSGLRMILEANIPKEDFASLMAFRTGTAPLDPALADAFYERYGIPVLQNYGATEFAGGIAGWSLEDFAPFWATKRGSVGRLNKGVEARAVDPETLELVGPHDTGILEMRGPNIGDGREWVRTTDLGKLDEDGFLWIYGRSDNAIIRGGFKVNPDDIVRALEAHPSVREAAVTALDDERLGQVPAAGYIVKAGAPALSPDEAKAYLKEKLMPYQVPVRLLSLKEFPRTPSMKVSQPALKELFLQSA